MFRRVFLGSLEGGGRDCKSKAKIIWGKGESSVVLDKGQLLHSFIYVLFRLLAFLYYNHKEALKVACVTSQKCVLKGGMQRVGKKTSR